MKIGEENLKMPVVFIGHGSPLNALSQNEFTKTLKDLGKSIPRPKAVLCISAHWPTRETKITSHPSPKTIHDFFGFPHELYQLLYPAPGLPELALKITETLASNHLRIYPSLDWGLDHGTWVPLLHMFPEANIPILQMSLNMEQSPEFHFQLGQQLRFLRQQGVLILGSGNIVHNLQMADWNNGNDSISWAKDFDQWVIEHIQQQNYEPLIYEMEKHPAAHLSVPTLEHYLPLLYVLGASTEEDVFELNYRQFEQATISLTSFSMK